MDQRGGPGGDGVRGGGEDCPACGAAAPYRLGDGRRKCRCCRRRYTPGGRGSRLPPETLRRLALCFWQMLPARQAARVAGVNRKTAQRHYGLLRRAIGGEGWPVAAAEQGERPVAALVVEGEGVRVAPAASEPAPGALVYAGEGGAGLEALRLWRSGGGEGGGRDDPVVKFWGFAGRLGRFYGRCGRQELPCFLREVAFRVNQRENPQVVELLCRLLETV